MELTVQSIRVMSGSELLEARRKVALGLMRGFDESRFRQQRDLIEAERDIRINRQMKGQPKLVLDPDKERAQLRRPKGR